MIHSDVDRTKPGKALAVTCGVIRSKIAETIETTGPATKKTMSAATIPSSAPRLAFSGENCSANGSQPNAPLAHMITKSNKPS